MRHQGIVARRPSLRECVRTIRRFREAPVDGALATPIRRRCCVGPDRRGAGPAAARNMLGNSSFEVGIDARYAVGRWYMNGLPKMSLDSETKVDGAVSLRVPFSRRGSRPDGPFGMELRGGAPVMVEKGKTYTFSVYLKTDCADVDAALEISPLRPYDYRGRAFKREKITLGRHYTPQGFEYPWKRESITFTAEKSGEVYWVIDGSSKRRGALWVDALKFEEGPLTRLPAEAPRGRPGRRCGRAYPRSGRAARFDAGLITPAPRRQGGQARLRVLNDRSGGLRADARSQDGGQGRRRKADNARPRRRARRLRRRADPSRRAGRILAGYELQHPAAAAAGRTAEFVVRRLHHPVGRRTAHLRAGGLSLDRDADVGGIPRQLVLR